MLGFRGLIEPAEAILKDEQCCQGAEMSAAELKGAFQKFVRPEKLATEIPINMLKKGRKGVELF
jgi:hypothetical protein